MKTRELAFVLVSLIVLSTGVSAQGSRVALYFDEGLSQTSFCGYEDMAGDTIQIYMVAENVTDLEGAVFAIRGDFCNLCLWDIRATHYPDWVTSWNGVPLDTNGAEIHGEPQPGPQVLLAILDVVFLDPDADEESAACSAAPDGGPNQGLIGWWDVDGNFFPADTTCAWAHKTCPPTPSLPMSWGCLKRRFGGGSR
jgi:hypothetical protein